MIGYWLKRFDFALEQEVKHLDSVAQWSQTLGGRDPDVTVIKCLRHIQRAIRTVVEEGA